MNNKTLDVLLIFSIIYICVQLYFNKSICGTTAMASYTVLNFVKALTYIEYALTSHFYLVPIPLIILVPSIFYLKNPSPGPIPIPLLPSPKILPSSYKRGI